jgi:ankyrin repeat protein
MMAAIHAAAQSGNVNRVRNRLNAGTNVNEPNLHFRYTPLHFAAKSGRLDTVRFLLDRGASVDARTAYKETPLLLASAQGYVNVVEELIRHGARVNARDSSGKTSLMYATHFAHPRVVRVLVEAGAKLSYRNVTNGGVSASNLAQYNTVRSALGARVVQRLKKRKAERMLSSRRLLGGTPLPPNAIRTISRFLTVRKKTS